MRRHKTLMDWARQMNVQLRRWSPHRPLVVVTDSDYAALVLLHACQQLSILALITHLRLDAASSQRVSPCSGKGRPNKKG